MIQTNKLCQFTDECNKCNMQSMCISATRLTYGDRRFLLSLRNAPKFTLETKEKFKKGIAKHKEHQEGIKDINDYGYIKYRRDLYKKKTVRIAELKICSPIYGIHGIVDLVTVKHDNDTVIYIDELKSGFKKSHWIQLLAYAIILSDRNCKLIYNVQMKKGKIKRKLGIFHHGNTRYLKIRGRIFIFNSKSPQHYWEIMFQNQFTESAGNVKSAIMKRIKHRREAMLNRVIDIRAIPYCNGCSKDKKSTYCGWRELCSKYSFNPKLKQVYFSKHKIKLNKDNILIKTKPR